ncbi:MAG: T9SS type A sorting domain-containing protein [Paludibacter sp.]|nr:T9SS type A sorting domain-containing protein [Paludibacter sp.]
MNAKFKSLINHLINPVSICGNSANVANNLIYLPKATFFGKRTKNLRSLFVALLILGVSANSIFAQITQVGTAKTVYGTNVQSVTVAQPTGLSIGDFVIVTVIQYNTLTTSVPLINNNAATWTCINTTLNSAGTVQAAVFYKIADYNTVNNPLQIATNTPWWPQAGYIEASIVAYRGVDSTSPLDVAPGSITVGNTSGSTSLSGIPGITTITNNALVLLLGMSYNSTGTSGRTYSNWKVATSPTLTENYDVQGTNYVSVGAATGTQATAGSTGTGSFSVNSNAYLGGILLALRPFIPTPCAYTSNSNSGIVVTPVINMPSHPQAISTNFASGKYFDLNVIQGLTYQLYTSSYPGTSLKMAVYQEGNPSSAVLGYSYSNTGNPGGSNSNDVNLSFTSPLSGQVRVLINSQADCSSTAVTGLTVNVNVSGGQNTLDSQTAAGTNSWIGQVWDSQNFNNYTYDNYLGYYNVASMGTTDQFQEMFGTSGTFPNGANDDVTSFPIYSNGVVEAAVLDYTFDVKYLMNSTRRGFYGVTITSDDGSQLIVDGTTVYNHWDPHSPTTNNNILFSLSGSSSLELDYFEQGGQNVIGFYNLVQIFSNTLSANTTQVVCQNTSGSAISGDIFGTLPSGVTAQGYQWYYSTSLGGTQTAIAGATGATFTPVATASPFNNVAGVYYLYRYAKMQSTNNYNPSTYIATNVSNAATVRISACKNFWTGNTSTTWSDPTNWSAGSVPYPGDDVVFATTANNGTAAVKDLYLDQDREIGNLINQSGKRLVIPPALCLTVDDSISSNDVVGTQIYIQSSSSAANGSLIFHNKTTKVYGTVEMYSKASYDATGVSYGGNTYHYSWQYFGIPLNTVVANPTFAGSYIRRWDETGTTVATHWVSVGNSFVLQPFIGYEITQQVTSGETLVYQGQLVNWDWTSPQLSKTTGALFPGQQVLANPYTAAIDIKKIVFGSDMLSEVFLYNTGSFASWGNGLTNAGQYVVVTPAFAGTSGIPGQVPSMQAILVQVNNSTANAKVTIPYSSVVKNTDLQRAKAFAGTASSNYVSTKIDVVGAQYSDRMWIFTDPAATKNFDNGFDGVKMLGAALTPQLYAIEPDGIYQINAVDDMNNTVLGFQPGVDSEYTFTFTHENTDSRYSAIFLRDSVEKRTIDITANGSQYHFTVDSTSAKIESRFKIIAINNDPASTTDPSSQLKIFNTNGTFFVENQSNETGEFRLYDMTGRNLISAKFQPNSVTEITTVSSQGVYIANATTNSQKVSKRFVVN